MILRHRRIALALVAAVALSVASPPVHAEAVPQHNPVIIVPGVLVGPLDEFIYYPLRDRLRRAGFDTVVFTKPYYGVDGVHVNAERLEALVDNVRARTGSAKVDLVGHSQGGLVTRDYIKYLGGADTVDLAIIIASPNRGTRVVDLVSLLGFGNCFGLLGCQEMATYSGYLETLNTGDTTIGDVRYTTIVTRYDELAVPYTTGFLPEEDGNVSNIDVQSQCPELRVEHLFIIFSAAVADGITDALDDRPVQMDCSAH